jgi:hypothetical protein
MNSSTVRPGIRNAQRGASQETLKSPGHDDTDYRPGMPTERKAQAEWTQTLTDACPASSRLDIAIALRHPPLPAVWYELAGVDYEEVAA